MSEVTTQITGTEIVATKGLITMLATFTRPDFELVSIDSFKGRGATFAAYDELATAISERLAKAKTAYILRTNGV